jgi:V8-like Glu-specific endopeptidase
VEEVMAGIQHFPRPADSRSPLLYDYPPPYTRYEQLPWYQIFPTRAIGKLYFTQNGSDYYCTASSIGNHAVWTAGHCVSDGAGNFSYNFAYVPAEQDLNPIFPWAVWNNWYNAWVMTDYHLYTEHCRDSAGVVFYPLAGTYPVSIFGWLGFAWNFSPDTHWHEIGYPGDTPFDGSKQIVCASSRSWYDDCLFAENPQTIGAGCDQTPGCSGGPWIKDYQPLYAGANNYLNGNFSYGYIGFPEEIYSPYFDDLTYTLWEYLINDEPM